MPPQLKNFLKKRLLHTLNNTEKNYISRSRRRNQNKLNENVNTNFQMFKKENQKKEKSLLFTKYFSNLASKLKIFQQKRFSQDQNIINLSNKRTRMETNNISCSGGLSLHKSVNNDNCKESIGFQSLQSLTVRKDDCKNCELKDSIHSMKEEKIERERKEIFLENSRIPVKEITKKFVTLEVDCRKNKQAFELEGMNFEVTIKNRKKTEAIKVDEIFERRLYRKLDVILKMLHKSVIDR